MSILLKSSYLTYLRWFLSYLLKRFIDFAAVLSCRSAKHLSTINSWRIGNAYTKSPILVHTAQVWVWGLKVPIQKHSTSVTFVTEVQGLVSKFEIHFTCIKSGGLLNKWQNAQLTKWLQLNCRRKVTRNFKFVSTLLMVKQPFEEISLILWD